MLSTSHTNATIFDVQTTIGAQEHMTITIFEESNAENVPAGFPVATRGAHSESSKSAVPTVSPATTARLRATADPNGLACISHIKCLRATHPFLLILILH